MFDSEFLMLIVSVVYLLLLQMGLGITAININSLTIILIESLLQLEDAFVLSFCLSFKNFVIWVGSSPIEIIGLIVFYIFYVGWLFQCGTWGSDLGETLQYAVYGDLMLEIAQSSDLSPICSSSQSSTSTQIRRYSFIFPYFFVESALIRSPVS